MNGRLALGLMCTLLVGCTSSDGVFSCQNDDQCVSGEANGICEPNGYCSFADPQCPSGHRYSQNAPAGLAGACVDLPQGSTGVGSTNSTSTSSGGSSTTDDPVTTVSSEATTSSSTTDVADSSSTTRSSSGSSSTTSSLVCPEFVDEFDNGEVGDDPWTWTPASVPLMFEAGDVLRYSITDDNPEFGSIGVATDLSEGYAVVHLTAMPQEPASQFVLHAEATKGQGPPARFIVSDRNLLTLEVGGTMVADHRLLPAPTELWLEFFVDAGNVYFLHSIDGEMFTELANVPTPFDFSDVTVSLVGGSFQPISGAAHLIEVDDFEMCSMPFGS